MTADICQKERFADMQTVTNKIELGQKNLGQKKI